MGSDDQQIIRKQFHHIVDRAHVRERPLRNNACQSSKCTADPSDTTGRTSGSRGRSRIRCPDRRRAFRFFCSAHPMPRQSSYPQSPLWPWIEQASKRLHCNMLAIALANKYRLGRARPRSRISADNHAPRGLALTLRPVSPSRLHHFTIASLRPTRR
jgi:hypothetical protein